MRAVELIERKRDGAEHAPGDSKAGWQPIFQSDGRSFVGRFNERLIEAGAGFPARGLRLMVCGGLRAGSTRRHCSTSLPSCQIAKPTPVFWPVLLAMAVFMPITSPRSLSSGPPELPWLMAASV